jgi:hypothetical protein
MPPTSPRTARPSLVALLAALALPLVGVQACGRDAPARDQSTPERAVASFFAALAAGDVPEHSDALLADDTERRAWRLRCKTAGGCRGGHAQVLGRAESGADAATLLVDYEVSGDGGARLMQGSRSPLRLVRDGERWLIAGFGEQILAPVAPAAAVAPAAPADAAPTAP